MSKNTTIWAKSEIFKHLWWSFLVKYSNRFIAPFAKNTFCKIPQFHLISWCGNFVKRHSFRIVFGESKLCLSTKFPHQEIRWNCGVLRSDHFIWQGPKNLHNSENFHQMRHVSQIFVKLEIAARLNRFPLWQEDEVSFRQVQSSGCGKINGQLPAQS